VGETGGWWLLLTISVVWSSDEEMDMEELVTAEVDEIVARIKRATPSEAKNILLNFKRSQKSTQISPPIASSSRTVSLHQTRQITPTTASTASSPLEIVSNALDALSEEDLRRLMDNEALRQKLSRFF
jgi:hypothetical protein